MGRIGLSVARRARAFGLSIHYHNRKRLPEAIEEELGASYHASVDTLLRISDVVTIPCPHTNETHEMVSAARIGARSEEHTSELQSLMRSSYAVFCLKKKKDESTTTSKSIKQET